MTLLQPSGGFEWVQAPWGAALRCVPLLTVAPHVFTVGNLQLRDDPSEWGAVAAYMDVAPSDVRLIRQVHRAGVAVADQDGTDPAVRPEADAIVSSHPAAAIGVRVADCTPILLADRGGQAVAAVHAGWRGTVQRIAGAALDSLSREYGVSPRNLVAAIGPCLGPCCGEVGTEVVQAFRDAGHAPADVDRWFAPGPSGRPYLDLWSANRDQLIAGGVNPDNIHVAALCTRSHPETFHSYRAAGAGAGRMLASIRVRA